MIPTHHIRQHGHDFASRLRGFKPKLYYRCNEASGSTLANMGSLGVSNNATITGTPTFGAAGLPNINDPSIVWSGSTNYASSPNGVVNSLDAFTIGCWFKYTSTSANLAPIVLRDITGSTATSAPLVILANSAATGKITLYPFSTGATSISTAAATYNDGNRHFLVAAIDGAGTVGILWLDGVREGTAAVGARASASCALTIASNRSSSAIQFFPGTVDEAFLIHTKQLSDAEVLALYNAGIR